MVIRVPEEDSLRVAPVSHVGSGRLGRVRQDVLAADRVVAAEQYITAPFADEHAFDRAALVSSIRVDRPPALRRPAHDLDRAPVRIVDELAITLQRVGSGIDDVHGDAPQARGERRVEIVEGVWRYCFRGSVPTRGSI